MAWTDDRVDVLKKMWGEGKSASQIAKELGGVTRNAVIGKVHRLGLSNRATTPKATTKKEPGEGENSTNQRTRGFHDRKQGSNTQGHKYPAAQTNHQGGPTPAPTTIRKRNFCRSFGQSRQNRKESEKADFDGIDRAHM